MVIAQEESSNSSQDGKSFCTMETSQTSQSSQKLQAFCWRLALNRRLQPLLLSASFQLHQWDGTEWWWSAALHTEGHNTVAEFRSVPDRKWIGNWVRRSNWSSNSTGMMPLSPSGGVMGHDGSNRGTQIHVCVSVYPNRNGQIVLKCLLTWLHIIKAFSPPQS